MIPGLPFAPFASSTVQVAAGGIVAPSFGAGAITAPAIAAGALTAAAYAPGSMGVIASIRRGTIALGAAVASASAVLDPVVDPTRCEVRWCGVSRDTSNDPNLSDCLVRVQVDGDGDSVTVTRGVATQAITVGWELTEWR